MKWNRDCRSFPGIYACEIMTAENFESCEACPYYEKISKKIAIIKLGAMGDIIRTLSILPAIREKFGSKALIVWIVSEENKDLLKYNAMIDRIDVLSEFTLLRLQQEKFDILYSLEVSPPGSLVANIIKADEKYGFYFNKDGHPSCFNLEAIPYLKTVFSNRVNKDTKKTYQESVFEILRLPYRKIPYQLELATHEKKYATDLLKNVGHNLIGINIGSGGRWASKSWHPSKIIGLIKLIYTKTDYKVILLGGKNEDNLRNTIIKQLRKHRIKVFHNNSNNTIREFMAVIDRCNVIITGDTLALHIAIGLGKKTIALFFCTPPWQLESYNLVTKIQSTFLDTYFMDDLYHDDLVNSIASEEVFERI